MKPIVIYLETDKNELITLSKQELERIINDVYNQGKQDSSYSYYPMWGTSNPNITNKPITISWSGEVEK